MKFDVEGWADDHLERVRRSGSNGRQRKATCPFCARKDVFSVNVDPDDEKHGAWVCFNEKKCGRSGRAGPSGFAILMAHVEGITEQEARAVIMRQTVNFPRKETTQTLLERIQRTRGGVAEAPARDDVEVELPKEFKPVYDEKKNKWFFPSYLKDRGIARATARAWGMGFCQGGRYAGRVVFPFHDPLGRSLTARTTLKDVEPRYLNPEGVDNRRLLFGWHMVPPDGDVVLVEGPLDAVMCWQHGIPAIALTGYSLTDDQFSTMCRRPADSAVTVMLDPTEKVRPFEIASRLRVHFDDVRVAMLTGEAPRDAAGKPQKLDPGCATREQLWAAVDGAERVRGGARLRALEAMLGESAAEGGRIYGDRIRH